MGFVHKATSTLASLYFAHYVSHDHFSDREIAFVKQLLHYIIGFVHGEREVVANGEKHVTWQLFRSGMLLSLNENPQMVPSAEEFDALFDSLIEQNFSIN